MDNLRKSLLMGGLVPFADEKMRAMADRADAVRRQNMRDRATAHVMEAVKAQPESRQVRRARERRERAH